jgi:hypothetical protein
MAYSILGFITGFGIARSVGLDDSQAVRVGIIPGILGFNLPSILIAGVVADQEVKSLPPPVLLKAAIEVAPDTHIYGNVNLNSTACKIFVVSNRGTAELDVTAITLSENPAAQFAIVSDVAPFTVAPGETHNVQVSFTPNSGGAKNASLDIASNDPDRPTVNITLSGTGEVRSIPDITVAVPFNFGNVPVDTTVSKSVEVSNRGTAELDVTAITLSDNLPAQFASDVAPFKVAPGETHNVQVSFTPNSGGAKNASLDIVSNDPNQRTVKIALSGASESENPRTRIPALPASQKNRNRKNRITGRL